MNIIALITGLAQQYWLDALIILFVIGLLIVLWRFGKKDFVKLAIKIFVAKAEKAYGSKTGQLKLAAVWADIYDRLPLIVRITFTKAELQEFIEEAVDWLRKKLAINGDYLLSYTDEKALEKLK